MTWPSVELDPIRRLEVMAAQLPGSALVERVLDAPFDVVWGLVGALEDAPRFDRALKSVRIVKRDGEHIEIAVTMRLGLRSRLEVELQRGWCWMRAPKDRFVVGMAAIPEGDRTRYAHLEGTGIRGARIFRPLFRWMVHDDIRGIVRVTSSQSG